VVAVVVVLFAVPVAAMPLAEAQTAAARVPSNPNDCKRDGWRNLVDDQGQPFRNQGKCVSWAIHHPHQIDLTDLTGSFNGTGSFTLVPGCNFVHQVFDAIYPGSSAVGDVTMHNDVCIDQPVGGGNFRATGTFTITTAVGTLTGTVSGIETVFQDPVPIQLALTPTAGTGAFTTTAGTLMVNGLWFPGVEGAATLFTGAVSFA
jgi:hypothetical protein